MRDGTRLERFTALLDRRRAGGESDWTGLLTSRERFGEARALVAAFYCVVFFLAVASIYQWPQHLASQPSAPLWPVFWLRWVDTRIGISIVLWLYLLGGLSAISATRYRLARIVVFVALLVFTSFTFSFGAINGGEHLRVMLSFMLVFLPAGWTSFPTSTRADRVATLLVFSGCQALILLTYSMSGLWKVVGIGRQLVAGEVSYLAPWGLAQQVAGKLLDKESAGLLGPWLIDHYWVGWPLALLAIYLEVASLWIVFRPSLHRVWGLGLILFHLGTHLMMGIGFIQNSLWLALFLVFSPFRPRRVGWGQVARGLPLLGRLARN